MPGGVLLEYVNQSRLTDTGLARHEDHLTLAVQRPLKMVVEPSERRRERVGQPESGEHSHGNCRGPGSESIQQFGHGCHVSDRLEALAGASTDPNKGPSFGWGLSRCDGGGAPPVLKRQNRYAW